MKGTSGNYVRVGAGAGFEPPQLFLLDFVWNSGARGGGQKSHKICCVISECSMNNFGLDSHVLHFM